MSKKIFDCFIFNNEINLLKIRFNILNDYVDYFVICESKFDHNKKLKKFNFNINLFTKFKKKIIYIKITEPPQSDNPWINQSNQRNTLINGIEKANPEDYIIYSDVDEIPNPLKIKEFTNSHYKFGIFMQFLFYYKLNLLSKITYNKWEGSRICKKKYLKSFENLRTNIRKKNLRYKFYRIDKLYLEKNIKLINNGGWHFSYLMNAKEIIKKIKSSTHTEYNKKEYLNSKIIEKKIRQGKDLFNRRDTFNKIEFTNKIYPKYLIKNKKKFKDLII
jgi:beta-1,4-mannosyl-glycoprotein beta-1,4-N-acetylglucosaminyltransferase